MWGAIAGLGGALLGGLAGSMGSKSSQTTTRNVGGESAQERQARGISQEQLTQLNDLITGTGPGAVDLENAYKSQQNLITKLQELAASGGIPSAENYAQAGRALAPEREQLNQFYQQLSQNSARRSAQLGRASNDPILAAKLAESQGRALSSLSARQTALAQQLPLQQLGFQQQAAALQSGLASQALQNRQTLLNLGNSIQAQGQNFRLGAAGSTTTGTSGGGLQGAITGALGGAGAGMSLFNQFSKLGSADSSGGGGGGAGGGGGMSNSMFAW